MENQKCRHAWMIMAHGSFDHLERLLRFLDSENADVFLHIDAKVCDFDFERFRSAVERSNLTFVSRVNVSWGDFSQIEAELSLLHAAVGGHYDYYHLLSGVDAPLKTREYIENFFTPGSGVNYVQFYSPTLSREYTDRARFYYPLQRLNLQNRKLRTALRRVTIALERPFVDRLRAFPPGWVLQKGSQWFSITHELAEYLLSKEDWIRKTFSMTFCCDELFVQTLVFNSDFRDSVYSWQYGYDHRPCLRYIDWHRGKPYTFRAEDIPELKAAAPDTLFARKFGADNAADALFDFFGES